ncbi:MAG: glutaconate CoA-transferase, partial [Chloroflexi bacterium]|nr:glutaconate CoA-transferase [Chloroflexota bacterium]
MQKQFEAIVECLLNPADEGEDKVMALEAAIAQNVKPGMTIHLAGEPSAAARQILRQFWGQDPRFTLVSGAIFRPYASAFVRYGLVSKVITSAQENPYGPAFCPEGLPGAGQLAQGIETENWSLYSIEQRLMAGALGVGFMPTKSIAGSDMAKENHKSFKMISDPFDDGRRGAVVKALVPDISFVHGCAADPYGNTILPAPYSSSIWGPR